MYFRFFTHIIGFLINIWWQLILITNNYEVIYVIKTVMKYYLEKIDTSFHQRLPNMVQRLFADVIHDAIWFMNIHEQNHPWFLAMFHSWAKHGSTRYGNGPIFKTCCTLLNCRDNLQNWLRSIIIQYLEEFKN